MVFKSEKKIICTEEKRQADLSNVVADISKAKEELNWEPQFSIEESLQKIYQEYILPANNKS